VSVTKNDHVKFEFTKGYTCVDYLEFDSKKTTRTTTATIENLKEKSTLASSKPQGEIYNNLNIRIGKGEFTDPKNLENAIVGFRVSKAWIDENNIDTDSIVIQHFVNKKWDSLQTEKTKEDDNYIYFKAKTSCFSPFAISAEKNEIVIEQDRKTQEIPESKPNGQPETNVQKSTQKNTPSKENNNQNSFKIVTFFAGLAIVLIIGAIIMKKKGPKQ